MPLSDVAIRKARPADKPLRLFDGGGLYLEISPTGSKLWRWKYRFAGKEKRLALGVYPETSLAEARASHAAARKLLNSGVDPGVQRKVWGYDGSIVVRAALKLAPMLFARPGELRAARWSDVDLDACEWRYVATKTGTPHIVPLATQAVEVLRELQPITGRGEYVFPSLQGKGRPMSENTINAAMRRMGFDSKTMTGHGFRAMARTILDEVLGFRPDYIEHQLAHAVRDPNGRAYNRTASIESSPVHVTGHHPSKLKKACLLRS
jgi:integrase